MQIISCWVAKRCNPTYAADLANEMLKDPYHFDFLTIQGKAHERAIEDALVTHIRDFLIQLLAPLLSHNVLSVIILDEIGLKSRTTL